MSSVSIHPSWKKILSAEFEKEYWKELTSFVRSEYKKSKVYPPPKQLFSAFDACPFEDVVVVIVGQDPYHGPRQANGLCFSVSDDMTVPPSLKNIFKEINSDLGVKSQDSGDLSRWAKQGVLLLNSVLTVEAGKPASHKEKGWEIFTSAVIDALNSRKKNLVYMLWGKYAQQKGEAIDRSSNLVLTSAHPSPFSATAFFGNHHFSRCNEYLKVNEKRVIDWR